MQIKLSIPSIILTGALIILAIFTMRNYMELQDKKKVAQQMAEQEQIHKANQKFIQQFFTYHSIKMRYEKVKELTTEKGYKSISPSNALNDDQDTSVTSTMDHLKAYMTKIEGGTATFYNEFDVSITYDGDTSKQPLLVKTTLVKEKNGRGWRVDDMAMIQTVGVDVDIEKE